MNKIKGFIFSEKKLSRAIFGFLIIAAFAFIFGPNIYAQFTRETGDAIGWGYGYGYGYGFDYDDNSNGYRIGGSATNTDYEYDYGYGDRAAVQLTISAPSVTTSKVYDGNATAAVTAGTLSGVVAGETVTVSAAATYESASVGTSKTIIVVYTLGGANAGNYIKPIDYSTTGTITAASSGGGGGGSYTQACTEVTYGDYAGSCFVGYQYRNIASRTPLNCALTAAQQDAARRACAIAGDGTTVIPQEEYNAAFVALEKYLVKSINKALSKRLAGRILLQVESHGEAWYVNPVDVLKYYLGRPDDAFAIMRKFGLGISEKDYTSFSKSKAPSRLAGRILLRVKAHGEAYYVNPADLKLHYLGRPADAFALMRKFGLGITNANLRQIGVGEIK